MKRNQEYFETAKANKAKARDEGYVLSGPMVAIGFLLHLEDMHPGLKFSIEHTDGSKIKVAEAMIREALYCKHHNLPLTKNVLLHASEYTKDGWIDLELKLEEDFMNGTNLGLTIMDYSFIAGNHRFSLNTDCFRQNGIIDFNGYLQNICDLHSGKGYRVKWVINEPKDGSTSK